MERYYRLHEDPEGEPGVGDEPPPGEEPSLSDDDSGPELAAERPRVRGMRGSVSLSSSDDSDDGARM